MKSLPKISVLMPVWDRGDSVKFAIHSIEWQSFQDWELVVIDDGSTDNTWQEIKAAMNLDKRIIGIRRKHEGIVKALNFGNQECGGEIIVKQDSDDISLPNRLSKIVSYFENNSDTDFFYHGMYQTWGDDKDTQIINKVYIPALPIEKRRILKEQYIPGAFAYTKHFIQKKPYRQLHCSEDWMLILDAFLSGAKVGFLDEGLYDYALRFDSNSLRHENTGHYEEDEKEMRRILLSEYGIKKFKYAERK